MEKIKNIGYAISLLVVEEARRFRYVRLLQVGGVFLPVCEMKLKIDMHQGLVGGGSFDRSR
jgi:hypothetical protein